METNLLFFGHAQFRKQAGYISQTQKGFKIHEFVLASIIIHQWSGLALIYVQSMQCNLFGVIVTHIQLRIAVANIAIRRRIEWRKSIAISINVRNIEVLTATLANAAAKNLFHENIVFHYVIDSNVHIL